MKILAGNLTEFSDGKLHLIWVGEHGVAVVSVEGQLSAFVSECPHRGAQLAQGKLEGPILTCPWHQWRFDVVSGQGLTNPHAKLHQLAVTIENARVYVDVPEAWTTP